MNNNDNSNNNNDKSINNNDNNYILFANNKGKRGREKEGRSGKSGEIKLKYE